MVKNKVKLTNKETFFGTCAKTMKMRWFYSSHWDFHV